MPHLASSTAISARVMPIDWKPSLSVFASEPFLKGAGDEYGWLGGYDSLGMLRCVLPYTIVRKAILRMVRFRVETISVGEPISIEEEKSFLTSAMEILRQLGADMVIPATTNTIFRTYPEGAIAVPYGTYLIDLTATEEALFGGLNSSHRRKVRVAAKEGVKIQEGLQYSRPAYELVRDTFKRSNLGFMSYEAFDRMLKSLGEYIRILVAEKDGVIQACVVVPFSEARAYYVYGGSIPSPASGATVFLHWETIRHFRALGVKSYDFVGVRINPKKGSKQEGLKEYKERFGGQLLQGYLWKYAFKPLKFSMYNLAARLRRGGDIVDQERERRDEQEPEAPASDAVPAKAS